MTSMVAAPRASLAHGWRTQLGVFAAAYLLYSAARWICVGDLATAQQHAGWILDLERAVLLDVESGVQGGLSGTPLLWLLNHLYLAAQLIVVPGALVWLYRRDRGVYRRLRDTVLATWMLSVPIYALFPVAPPRLADIGMSDTITEQTGVALDSSLTTSFYNELAAVPSLHVGFAAAVSVALALALRARWARLLALAWGPLITLAVVATGNHFVMDAVAGLAVTAAGFGVGALARGPVRVRRLAGAVVAGAAVLAVCVLAVAGAIPLPDVDAVLENASESLGAWAYPAVAGLAMLETGAFVGLLVPGETAVVVGGVIAARGEVELVPLILVVAFAAALGDLVSFAIGRRLGRAFIERHGPRLRLGPERLELVERFYERHGGKAVLLGRFTGVVRAVSPFVAGASGLALRRFLPWSAAGALLWAATFSLVGYAFSESFAEAGETAARIAVAGAVAITAAFVLVAIRRARSDRRVQNERSDGHVEGMVETHVPRQPDGHCGGGGECGRAMSGRERRAVGHLREQPQTRVVDAPSDAPGARPLILAVNGRASGIEEPRTTALRLLAVLEEHTEQARAAVVTRSERDLHTLLELAVALDWRVVLVGGDGTLHAAANAPLRILPELAIVPAGRANNIARVLGIPRGQADALAVAARGRARPLDALRVATPDRFVYALEAVSAGFHAEARRDYKADNSSDLRQGIAALLRAVARFRPYETRLRLDDGELRERSAAQILVSNLPFFGFGFEVAPGADPADGRLEAVVFEARSRRRLARLLLAARRGRHVGARGVSMRSALRARIASPLPLVADTVWLGTTTATVTVEPARLRVASPDPGARP